jgi:hypothetical protein
MPPLAKGSRGPLRLRRSLWAVVLALVTLVVALTTGAFASAAPCDLFASGSGSDTNPGTQASPFRTASRLAAALAPGQTGCLAGQTFAGDLTFTSGGRQGAPITITSADTGQPATIRGRIVTKPGGDWITFSYLRLDGINADGLPSPTIGSDHVTLLHDDITNEHTAICINVIDSSTWGTGHYTTIEANRIHGCGKLPAQNHDHGVYDSGYYTTVTNNLIYDNADRGVQLRGAHGAVVSYNVIDGNGEGVIFGDLTSANNEVAHNIVTNSVLRSNVESYWGATPVGTGNVFHDNCVFATNTDSYYNAGGGVNTRSGGYAVQNVTIGDPAYRNRAAGDYTLQSTSKCTGFGVRSGVTPGIDAAASAPAAPAPPATSPPATSPPATSPPVTSPPPTSPTAIAPAATSAPTIAGVAQTGKTLLASTGTWTGTQPLSRRFQWRRCNALGLSCADVAGAANGSYLVSPADLGSRLRVVVTATNVAGSASATSGATGVVAAAPPAQPTVVPPLQVTHAFADGATLSGVVTWSASPSGATVDRVDFLVDGVVKWTEHYAPYVFNGDGGRLDTTTLRDGAHTLSVEAYGSGGGVATVSSRVTVQNSLAPSALAAPSILGRARKGRELTVTTGAWAGNPTEYAYRWLRCNRDGGSCVALPGATSATYRVRTGDVGRRIRAQVTARNALGTGTSQSNATVTVDR